MWRWPWLLHNSKLDGLVQLDLFPFCCMVVSTAFIIKHLARSRKRLTKKRTSSQAVLEESSKIQEDTTRFRVIKASASSNTTWSTTGDHQHRNSQSLVLRRKREQKDFTFALTSILINVVFIMLNIGIVVFCLLSSYIEMDSSTFLFFNSISINIFFTDYVIKFFLYYLVNSKFRSEFKNLFKFEGKFGNKSLRWEIFFLMNLRVTCLRKKFYF